MTTDYHSLKQPDKFSFNSSRVSKVLSDRRFSSCCG